MAGLYVVATPIGNLDDISTRAVRTLSEVDVIAAEDTRHTRRLLAAHGIKTPIVAYHEHNEEEASPRLVSRVLAGESVALVSDAGTPLVSDPGYRLIKAALAAGIPVVPIPGPSAVIAALSVSGLPANRFCFEGFLAARASARRQQLQALETELRTLVIYEAPHRISELVGDICEILGTDRNICVARELTKQFEQVFSGTAAEVKAALDDGRMPAKGEFVLVVDGAGQNATGADQREQQRVMSVLLKSLAPGAAATVASELLGVSRKPLYDIALALKKE